MLSSGSKSRKRDVFAMSALSKLRFKPQPRQSLTDTNPNNKFSVFSSVLSFCARRKKAGQKKASSQTPLEPIELLFFEKINKDTVALGSKQRVELLTLRFINEQFYLEVKDSTSIEVPYDIIRIRVEPKKNNIMLVGHNIIEIYQVDTKKVGPSRVGVYRVEKPLLAAEFFIDGMIILFFEDGLSILNCDNNNINPREHMLYNKQPGMRVFSIPTVGEGFANIFYKEDLVQTQEFNLYKQQLSYQDTEFTLSGISHICKLENRMIPKLSIANYDRDTFLINLETEIVCMKKHYPIDSGTLNYKHEGSKLIILPNFNILHLFEKRVDAHFLKVHSNSITIKAFDCIKYDRPEKTQFFGALNLQDDHFVLAFKDIRSKTPGEARYWLCGTITSSIKSKMAQLLIVTKNLKDIQDVAQKMGMTRCQIYLELWNQSPKKSRADYDLLLQTEDYQTITNQIKNALRKESISFRELLRIQLHCLKMLEKQSTESPTEANIRHYLKSHFLERKYQAQKNIQQKIKEQKKQIQDENMIDQDFDSKFQISIQLFTDVRNRNIKEFMIEMMKKRDELSLFSLQQYMSMFRFVLRVRLEEFIKCVIRELKADLEHVLGWYDTLLPVRFLMQDGSEEFTEASGLWSDIPPAEWEKNLYVEKMTTIDNSKILQDMIKKDWFRWDLFIKHDLVEQKKHEIEKTFLENRRQKIFYVFFDELFNVLKDNTEALQKITAIIEEKYDIPAHLRGKIFLYWELHKFFSTKDTIPGYQLQFNQFLALKEDQIYKIVFKNQKNCKNLVLKEIKQIYNRTCSKEVYDDSILTYFKADYSTIADLKYMLNRVNSEKIEFHEANQNLYTKLVEAVFYKLKWTAQQELPIAEIMVYFESIPLPEAELEKLQTIIKIERHGKLLDRANLSMSLNQFIISGPEVLKSLTDYFFSEGSPTQMKLYSLSPKEVSFLSILQEIKKVKNDLFASISECEMLQIIIGNVLDYEDLIPLVKQFIFDHQMLPKYKIELTPQEFLEDIVAKKVDTAFEAHSDFKSHEKYINSLLELLPEESPKKRRLKAHLQLGLLLSVLSDPPKAPLIFSSRFIQRILAKEQINKVKLLDIEKIYHYMQDMGSNEKKSSLYEVLVIKYLNEGEWDEAISITRKWNKEMFNSIVLSALVIMKLGEQLNPDLKSKLIDVIIVYYYKPDELLDVAQQIIEAGDIDMRKQIVSIKLLENQLLPEEFYDKNNVLGQPFKENYKFPQNMVQIKKFFDELRAKDIDLKKDQMYYLYYKLLLCEPVSAHELHAKAYDRMDIFKLQSLIQDCANKAIFNKGEVLMFFCKSLLLNFASNYLSQQFEDPEVIFNLSPEVFETHIKDMQRELGKEMTKLGERDKFRILLYMQRLYRESFNTDHKSIEAEPEQRPKPPPSRINVGGMNKSIHPVQVMKWNNYLRMSLQRKKTLDNRGDFTDEFDDPPMLKPTVSIVHNDDDILQNKTGHFDKKKHMFSSVPQKGHGYLRGSDISALKRKVLHRPPVMPDIEDSTPRNKISSPEYSPAILTRSEQPQRMISFDLVKRISENDRRRSSGQISPENSPSKRISLPMPVAYTTANLCGRDNQLEDLERNRQSQFSIPDQPSGKNIEFEKYQNLDEIESKIDYAIVIEPLIDEQVLDVVADEVVSKGSYQRLKTELEEFQTQQSKLKYLKELVALVFRKATFGEALSIVDKLRELYPFYQSAVKEENVKVMTHANEYTTRAKVEFDMRRLFTPNILYAEAQNGEVDKLIFNMIKPNIKSTMDDTNIFSLSKIVRLSFHFNKEFEDKVQYYYLQGLMQAFVNPEQARGTDAQMSLEKIEVFLNKLPLQMTGRRFKKMMEPLKKGNAESFQQLLSAFGKFLAGKKATNTDEKVKVEVEELESMLAGLQQ